MNYELAKQLKDAGFVCKPWEHRPYLVLGDDIDTAVPVPTLSELIEACGTVGDKPVFKFLSLHSEREAGMIPTPEGLVDMREHGRWNARARTDKRQVGKNTWVKINAWGHTAEEAVARLWLALQESKRAA